MRPLALSECRGRPPCLPSPAGQGRHGGLPLQGTTVLKDGETVKRARQGRRLGPTFLALILILSFPTPALAQAGGHSWLTKARQTLERALTTDKEAYRDAEPVDAAAIRDELILLTNGLRVDHRLRGLRPSARLEQVALGHSHDMAARRYFSHVSPDGVGTGARMTRDYPELVGAFAENIYHVGTENGGVGELGDAAMIARRVLDGWLGSPGHRANLLRRDMTRAGIGVWSSRRDVYVTQLFSRPVVVLDDPLPTWLARGATLALGMQAGPDLAGDEALGAYLVWPDPRRRFPLGDGRYLEGLQPLRATHAGGRITVALTAPNEPGRYRLRVGRGVRVYDLGEFEVR